MQKLMHQIKSNQFQGGPHLANSWSNQNVRLHIPLLFIFSITSRKEIEGLMTKKKKKDQKPTLAANQLKSHSTKVKFYQEPS